MIKPVLRSTIWQGNFILMFLTKNRSKQFISFSLFTSRRVRQQLPNSTQYRTFNDSECHDLSRTFSHKHSWSGGENFPRKLPAHSSPISASERFEKNTAFKDYYF